MVFSSRVIPGNERAIGTVQDNLVRRGVHLMMSTTWYTFPAIRPAMNCGGCIAW